ncbi:MAG: hypothetical protein ACUZ9M_09370 [Candidatus Scalindua sp.]
MTILHPVLNFRVVTHRANINDAIKLHVEDRIESGENIQQSESVSLILMEVSV